MRPFSIKRPATIEEAVFAAGNTAFYIAGGTNLVDLMKHQIAEPETLLDITNLLSGEIKENNGSISIGAMVKNTTAAEHKAIKTKYPLISKAILSGASAQIRNMASMGGNLLQRTRCPYFYDRTMPCNKRKPGSGCAAKDGISRMCGIVGYSEQCVAVHPSDLCVALAALEARVQIRTKDGKQQEIAFKDFHRLPEAHPERDNNLPEGAIITSINIPENRFVKNSHYLKLRDRDSYAFALVSIAAALQLNGNTIVEARLASGGVAHKPWRWYEAENYLKGKQATPEVFAAAAEIAANSTKPLAGNGFKKPMLKGGIEVALQNCLTV